MSDRATDERFMRVALAEARKALGRTSPNPAVGAVIVRGGRILGQGHHRAAGSPHAEIEALATLGPQVRTADATLYVTLEPCSTQGRTPPCTEAILTRGFARVVFGATDPNPAHAGRARRILQKAGIAVTTGVLRKECEHLNRAWNHWMRTQRPYVIAKCGQSLDGRISSHPKSRWLTSKESRADAMTLRSQVDAILVGAGTIRDDDPSLTVRGIPAPPQPRRIIWSKRGKIPSDAKVLTDPHRAKTEVLATPLAELLDHLGTQNVISILVEGGGQTLGAFFDQRLVNEVVFYTAPILIGGPTPAVTGEGIGSNEEALKLKDPIYERIGNDLKLTAQL